MAGIKCPPTVLQVHLKPRAEVHRRRREDNPDVAEISGGVARTNIHGPAKRDGQMLEVTTHSNAFGVHPQCRARGTREPVAKRDFAVHPLADFPHSRPAWRGISE